MAAKPRIALIGGGIGGLAAAIALRQRGFEPVVFEQADRLKEVGAGIQITPNSTKILRALGLEDAVRQRGFEPGFMLTRDMITGEVLFRTKAKGAMAERFGAGWFQISSRRLARYPYRRAGRCRCPPGRTVRGGGTC